MKTREKISLVNEIVVFFYQQCQLGTYSRDIIRNILIEEHDLHTDYDGDEDYWLQNILRTDLIKTDSDTLKKIHNDFLGVKIKNDIEDLFNQDGYAIRVLGKKESSFCNLNMYIRECKACIDSGNLIAATLLLRCCVEDFVNIKISPKKDDKIIFLVEKMGELIKKIKKGDDDFAMVFKAKKSKEVGDFLTEIRKLGNDTAHLNGKNLQDFIDTWDIGATLGLFCYLIECTILKKDIEELRDSDESGRLKSVGFHLKKKDTEVVNKKKSDEIDLDDEIPF